MLKAEWTNKIVRRRNFEESWGEKATLEKHTQIKKSAVVRHKELLRDMLKAESWKGEVEVVRD